jgi:hypothetical protein
MRIKTLIAALTSLVALAASVAGAEGQDVRALPLSITATKLPKSSFAEPSIALNSKDHVFFCGPKGLLGGNGFIRSEDWKTFARSEISDRGGGGDCELKVGPDDALYTVSLQLWAAAVRKSVDGGKSWDYQSTEDMIEQDREWLAPDPADGSIVYMGWHENSTGMIMLSKSLDGAKSFPIHTLVSSDPLLAPQTITATFPGPLRVDPTNHNRLYMVWTISSPDECVRTLSAADPANCVSRTRHRIIFGRSEDGGLTWINNVAMDAPPGSLMGALIPWVAVDRSGNVYVVAGARLPDSTGTQRNGLLYVSSTNHGDTWSPVTKVNAGTGAVVFPTVAAGNDGRVDVSWVESDRFSHDDTTGTWTVHFAQTMNGHDAAPTFTELTGPVVHRGDICIKGTLCALGGDRSMLDFMDMAIDSFGYAHMAVYSTEGAGHVLYWRQDAGPSTYGDPCAVVGAADCVLARPGPRA